MDRVSRRQTEATQTNGGRSLVQALPANGPTDPTDWNTVPWRQVQRRVRLLRQRIFRAAQAEDWQRVHRLQKLMLRSYSNRLLAVRRVTQTNRGKDTPGVDQVLVKTPRARGQLVDDLGTDHPWRAQPVKRVYIPKASGTKRALGIPTLRDRALQAMVMNALEPAWEARFEATSYGFRPGRGCHDAIGRIFLLAKAGTRRPWVVDADIEGAFDHIDHAFLLQTLGPVPGRGLIRQWLRAGYLDGPVFHPTDAGTPQGGVISPLLANIALHGLDAALGVHYTRKGYITSPRAVVRYADDFVVFTASRADAERVLLEVEDWLGQRGLRLSPEKTTIVHLTEGFDFLGFTIRHYPAATRRRGYTLLITPSKQSLTAIRTRMRAEWRALVGHSLTEVLRRLNPIIQGQAAYYRHAVSSRAFHRLDHWMFTRQMRWVRRTHPRKSWTWLKARYWGRLTSRQDRWVFGDAATGAFLWKYQWHPIERHVIVRGTASPDDPALRDYWARRRAISRATLPRRQWPLAQRQGDCCDWCGESLTNGEPLQVHHLVPRHRGGSDQPENLRLRHLYCHQQCHARQSTRRPVSDLLEPDALRGARPVLRGG